MLTRGPNRSLRRRGGHQQLSLMQQAVRLMTGPKCVEWCDISDLSTLFQDTSFATQVTGVGQAVAGRLDKSGKGNHVIQVTPAARPTLESRYNLLTKTENFADTSVWTNFAAGTGVNPVRAANDALDPDGELLADKITFNAPVSGDSSMIQQTVTGLVTGAGYVAKAAVKAATGADVGKVILYRSVTGTSYSSLALTDAYQTILLPGASSGSAAEGLAIGLRPALGGSSGSVSIHIAKASLVHASDAHFPYQRVNTATDYDWDFSKFPPYLADDGIDNSHASVSTIDLTGTDKITVVGAWQKASDATQSIPLEFGPNGGYAGHFMLINGNGGEAGPYWGVQSGGNVQAITTTSGYASPVTNVLAFTSDIAADALSLRVNGVQVATSPADQGTGTFGNYTLCESSREGTAFHHKGRRYGYALFNTLLTPSELAAVEAYWRSKSKAY